MLPVLQAIGAGLSAVSAIKNIVSDSSKSASSGVDLTQLTKANPAASGAATGVTGTKSTSGNSPTGAASASDMQDRFLKLLVVQMKNQDPLNPMDNAQITSQMAQISTVGGIDKLNSSMQSFSSQMVASQSLQSAALIGRQVYAHGSNLQLVDGKATGGVNLMGDADRIVVSIANSSGAVVRTLELGAAKAGMSAFTWDGKTDAGPQAAPGSYVVQATALRGATTVPVEPMTLGRIGGVSVGKDLQLNLEGGGAVGMTDVKRVI